jgi:biotin carboxyl carrier protein
MIMLMEIKKKKIVVIGLITAITLIAIIGLLSLTVFNNNNPEVASSENVTVTNQIKNEDDEPPVLAKNIGFRFDTYDPATKRAGDLVFKDLRALKDPLSGNSIWHDYGVEDNKEGSDQKNPQTVFYLPAGTKITSMIDGEVVGITELYSKDFGIMIAKDKDSKWRYEHEHVVKPLVKLGDKVKAGDVIAEIGAHPNSWEYEGYGHFDIGLYRAHPNGVGGSEDCVFKYLDPSVKAGIHAKVTAFYKGWEDYRGDSKIFDQENYFSPGCAIGETISWEQVAPAN